MKNINIKFPSGKTTTAPAGITGAELLDNFEQDKESILAVLVNNSLFSLNQPIPYNAEIEPVLDSDKQGAAVYRRSLCFLLAAAAHNIYPKAHLLVGHSLGYGYYYTLDTGRKITKEEISSLEDEMKRLVKEDILIETDAISYKDAKELFAKLELTETSKQLNCICPPYIKVNRLGDFSDMFFGPLVRSTGCLKYFKLMPYDESFLLRFPNTSNPHKLTEFHDIPTLFSIYSRYKKWGKQLGVTSAASLNELIKQRNINGFIYTCETFQTKCIADIADKIHKRKKAKVVLIAGPSSSGKTTTSMKLSLQLQALGYRPKLISLDNFYVGRDKNPKDENGNYDYECLEALDIPFLNQLLNDLFNGKEVEIPQYDFAAGQRYFNGTKMVLGPNDILMLEGIHGLNDKLTPLIDPELKFKIYLSALTQLNLDDHNRISTSDNRLIRRIVRDSNFRGKSAENTISMWDNVQKGEKLHIFPFQGNADAMLNTALDYELAVLKVYAEPLLRAVNPLCKEYSEAERLLRFLNNFSTIPATAVPARSIIREFIGGSAFKY
ncbi:MAG: nucleoside kinase [Treponema sp.]|nr:nucleoside kinase [Treponema sp.]